MSLPSINQGENAYSGASTYLKEYGSNQNYSYGSRAFGKELTNTNYGRIESNFEQLKGYVSIIFLFHSKI
jgi:hypothetical protein